MWWRLLVKFTNNRPRKSIALPGFGKLPACLYMTTLHPLIFFSSMTPAILITLDLKFRTVTHAAATTKWKLVITCHLCRFDKLSKTQNDAKFWWYHKDERWRTRVHTLESNVLILIIYWLDNYIKIVIKKINEHIHSPSLVEFQRRNGKHICETPDWEEEWTSKNY